jgi:carbamoyltransferase
MKILGISCNYHDSAACLVIDGRIVGAAEEERFTRNKHDQRFPQNAIRYCLFGIDKPHIDLDAIAFYEKPYLKFHRIFDSFLSAGPKAFPIFKTACKEAFQKKIGIKKRIAKNLSIFGVSTKVPIYCYPHHFSHAASAFYPSPFDQAAIIVSDGIGEWASTSIGQGQQNRIQLIKEIRFPHSLGLLYSAFTQFCGFKVNSGEYKLMGLAPYGQATYVNAIRENLIDIKEDGSYALNMDYFAYLYDHSMISEKFSALFKTRPRNATDDITKTFVDMAQSIQTITEEIFLKQAKYAKKITRQDKLVLAGGVALNCVSNGKLLRSKIFDDIWIQPASGDSGGAVGAALAVHFYTHKNRRKAGGQDKMKGTYLGPSYSEVEIKKWLRMHQYDFEEIPREDLPSRIAQEIYNGKVIGLFHGRMEFGPRALGNRSILADPRSEKMQQRLNQKIKFREGFRPFAPSCLSDRASDYFELDCNSPYMLLVSNIRKNLRVESAPEENIPFSIYEKLSVKRSQLPAVTHVDFSARIQTVERDTNPFFYAIIEKFEQLSGFGVIVDTSFNVRGEPIVCTPQDAISCFSKTNMDLVFLENLMLTKKPDINFNE